VTQYPLHRVPGFTMDIRRWPTVAAFADHLRAYDSKELDFARTAKGVVYHHTYKPTPETWRGARTLVGIARFYRQKRPPWDSGPHLFIVAGSPDPSNDGIWQLTPLNAYGIHAGECNEYFWGIEVVGDYDHQGWSEKTAELALGAGRELMKWAGLDINSQSVVGHRDCGSGKTCPGSAIDMALVRRRIALRDALEQTVPRYDADSYLTHGPVPGLTIEPWVAAFSRRTTIYDEETVRAICEKYREICGAAGLDWWLALAQVAHETGFLTSWWCAPHRRNPAGLGVTGDERKYHPQRGAWVWDAARRIWKEGLSFDGWMSSPTNNTTAIEAHVGRLLAYALDDTQTRHNRNMPEGVNQQLYNQRQLIKKALALRPLPDSFRGSAPTLKGLSTRWAPSPDYGARIARVANDVLGAR
jgi:hypothetical protein